ncbi:uncharacterized protein FOMMEDRAFT_132056 [Fomitiporia mediterranea MF3/22]|uniref:uncharacterized protein n=1 Tax=Fomitiporia mediterranea (strain MF3/22) TaxID=694068 RepID=UPI0004408765|nr:uncharacterized protein FOMMEDRAFT_132056 [Fomitiporia mediterranea MF3/22]EJD05563.1 hypothetical protein FOMMEDRAFT_132056 [Fomitiporia mediterranea MF3/22]
MSYPQSGWPPPHVNAFGGSRSWAYAVPPPHGHGHPYMPYSRPQAPPRDDYWATELQDNPLGLENMHIRSDVPERENSINDSNTARIPSSSAYSRASDFAHRNSYPPKSNTKGSLAASKSHPNTRVPSPSRPRHHDYNREHDVVAPTARYATYPEIPGTTLDGDTDRGVAAHHRPSSRAYGGRTSVPAEMGTRYSSASAAAAAAAQKAARSQTLPGIVSYRQHAGVGVSAREMQRSRTLPGEAFASGKNREMAAAASAPRRNSERYDYRQPADDDEESEEEDEDEEVRVPRMAIRSGHLSGTPTETKKERSKMDRVKAWIDNAKHALSSENDQDRDQPRDRVREREGRAKAKSRSKSYHSAHTGEDEDDDYEIVHASDVQQASAAQYARERIDPAGHSSVMGTSHKQTYDAAGLTRFGDSEIVEEPEDMYQSYATRQRSRSSSQHQHQKYSPRRVSPYQGRERLLNEDSSSQSSIDSIGDGEGVYHRQRYDQGRTERRSRGTPHPAPSHNLPVRNNSLRVSEEKPVGAAAQMQVQAHLPSPRSLRHSASSRTPSSRPSFEQSLAEREREHEREPDIPKSPNGHLMTGQSTASGAAGVYGYKTPPITPTRHEHTHRADGVRSPYAPHASVTATPMETGVSDAAPAYQTPARLAYLYRGSSASPSPASHRAAPVQPQPQAHVHHSQASAQQYGTHSSGTDLKPRKRSPRTSRSPSPLPAGQGQSSSSAYYAALDQARAPSRSQSRSHSLTHGNSHTHSHSYSINQGTTQTPKHDVRKRSSSRAAAGVGGYSSASGAAAAAAAAFAGVPSSSASTATVQPPSGGRHVRAGFWNRRGDHLTDTWHIIYCPPGRCYPRDLADYPDNAFQDHMGRLVKRPPDSFPELPESVPRSAGRAPEKGYDQFIKYVLVGSNS